MNLLYTIAGIFGAAMLCLIVDVIYRHGKKIGRKEGMDSERVKLREELGRIFT